MTGENKRRNIRDELARAADCLREADLLFQNQLLAGGVSRLYYYVFHTVRALLLTQGLEPRSHEGAIRLVSQHFVKPGILPPGTAHIFTRLMKYRAEADYDPAYVFTTEDSQELRSQAEDFARQVRAILSREGFD